MRRLEPAFLLPSHTNPVKGKGLITKQLTDYRDGIQWVYVATIRGANAGKSLDVLAEEIALPPHLRGQEALDELYGQIDWSVRAVYTNELGWFDGVAEALYRLPVEEQAKRIIETMGGVEVVLGKVEEALREGGREGGEEAEVRWAMYLLRVVKESGEGGREGGRVTRLEMEALRLLGGSVTNTNGRGYLLQMALELEGKAPISEPKLGSAFIEAIPIPLILEVMVTRLIPEKSVDVHMSTIYAIGEKQFYVTIRRGVVEIEEGLKPLPGTPDPVGIFRTSEAVFRRIALKEMSPARAVSLGEATIEGDLMAFMRMNLMFEQGA
jgi:alkyl sulfatase BDS1-like metallo-beta-lactamase superfamily hydrolase